MPATASIREIRHQIRIDLTDAPPLTDLTGRSRKPVGLRLDYGLRRDITRVDIVIEWQDEASLWPPVSEMPDWLRQIIDEHRPADVHDPDDWRPVGMGGWPVYPAA
ncbi:hypothetical protein [Streptomyces sp. NPDC051636]|uniref:hypothetical protein n=1 Tax=Streptomyces sp. NPDC051636 TaxID=3365663 RepID=UPI0037A6D947